MQPATSRPGRRRSRRRRRHRRRRRAGCRRPATTAPRAPSRHRGGRSPRRRLPRRPAPPIVISGGNYAEDVTFPTSGTSGKATTFRPNGTDTITGVGGSNSGPRRRSSALVAGAIGACLRVETRPQRAPSARQALALGRAERPRRLRAPDATAARGTVMRRMPDWMLRWQRSMASRLGIAASWSMAPRRSGSSSSASHVTAAQPVGPATSAELRRRSVLLPAFHAYTRSTTFAGQQTSSPSAKRGVRTISVPSATSTLARYRRWER